MTPRRTPSDLIRVTSPSGESLPLESGRTYPAESKVAIETTKCRAVIATSGYVSGVAAGSFLDKATGARDLGYGLDVVDFLLEPAPARATIPPGQYEFGKEAAAVHGSIAKRYVEGPQICTQAKKLAPKILRGDGFAAVILTHRWTTAYAPHEKAGSVWQQTLIFPEGERFFLAADRVTTVAESSELFLRIDLPGHIKHKDGAGFDHIYLSYNDPPTIPSTEFLADFPPDGRFLYRRGVGPKPERFVRAYQVDLGPGRGEGPWLAGMTLNPGDVYQAWCHQRGYVCLIEEIGGRAVRPGDTFGAAYLIGWFDDVAAMNRAYDRYRGASGWTFDGTADRPAGYRPLKGNELTAVTL